MACGRVAFVAFVAVWPCGLCGLCGLCGRAAFVAVWPLAAAHEADVELGVDGEEALLFWCRAVERGEDASPLEPRAVVVGQGGRE
eukprot:5571844-Prymnesium_polylepis.1